MLGGVSLLGRRKSHFFHISNPFATICLHLPTPSKTVQRLTPFVPEPIKAGDETLTFAKSKRSYTLVKVEADLRETKKRRLYASMSDPTASAAEPEPDSTVRATSR